MDWSGTIYAATSVNVLLIGRAGKQPGNYTPKLTQRSAWTVHRESTYIIFDFFRNKINS